MDLSDLFSINKYSKMKAECLRKAFEQMDSSDLLSIYKFSKMKAECTNQLDFNEPTRFESQ